MQNLSTRDHQALQEHNPGCFTAKFVVYNYIFYILGFSVLPIILTDLLGNTCLLAQVQKVLVCDWRISIRFVYFVFQGSLLSGCPVSGNDGLVKFASQISLIFLILVTCKNPLTITISFAILEQSRVILSQAG